MGRFFELTTKRNECTRLDVSEEWRTAKRTAHAWPRDESDSRAVSDFAPRGANGGSPRSSTLAVTLICVLVRVDSIRGAGLRSCF